MLEGLRQQAVVVETVRQLRSHQSWAGETHVQKSLFFLQNLLGVPLNYRFVLYKHGPYSFDLHNDIGRMRAYDFLQLEARIPYGPSFVPGQISEKLVTKFDGTVEQYRPAMEFVAKYVGTANVRELERYATTLYVKLEHPDQSGDYLAERIIDAKPHIALGQAKVAIQSVEGLMEMAVEKNLIEV